MAEITGITPQIRDKERCNIEVDGRFFCGMKLETVVKHRLKVGVAVSEEELSRLQLESEKLTALDKALTYITASMKTERDIRTYLRKKGYLEDVSDYVVEKMRSYGYLDDDAYARAYIEHAGKKKGSRLIAMELRQKGVSDEAIEEALSSVSGEEESALEVLKKYLRGKSLDRATLLKAYRHLMGKGFSCETAKGALERLGSDLDEEGEDQ
ncbi:MAG TPA: RecX family transcriptional regulator [Candidatus Gallimonas intestinavium]|uniref:Regulatory protein RecX n=1 Tax=Candidatus Gallimonas intestinavium TaxID=2838603 RepID=A0A9D2G5R0_9FIRM|nr:RecX family transcriptional regulator [Candidatus Gallimonas intestinavium]